MPEYLYSVRKGDRFVFVDPESGKDAAVVYPDGPFEATEDATPRRNRAEHVLVPVKTRSEKSAVFDLPLDTQIRRVSVEVSS